MVFEPLVIWGIFAGIQRNLIAKSFLPLAGGILTLKQT
jgi:hypothetical protein